MAVLPANISVVKTENNMLNAKVNFHMYYNLAYNMSSGLYELCVRIGYNKHMLL